MSKTETTIELSAIKVDKDENVTQVHKVIYTERENKSEKISTLLAIANALKEEAENC